VLVLCRFVAEFWFQEVNGSDSRSSAVAGTTAAIGSTEESMTHLRTTRPAAGHGPIGGAVSDAGTALAPVHRH